jgi:hypothetical protein
MAKKTIAPKRPRRAVTHRTAHKYDDKHPLTRRLDMIAHHWAEHVRQGERNDAARIAFAGYEAEKVALLASSAPRSLDHIISLLAVARGHASLRDVLDMEGGGKLNWDAADMHERLLLLHKVTGEAIYALCLMGGKVHPCAEADTDPDDWNAWAVAALDTSR